MFAKLNGKNKLENVTLLPNITERKCRKSMPCVINHLRQFATKFSKCEPALTENRLKVHTIVSRVQNKQMRRCVLIFKSLNILLEEIYFQTSFPFVSKHKL